MDYDEWVMDDDEIGEEKEITDDKIICKKHVFFVILFFLAILHAFFGVWKKSYT